MKKKKIKIKPITTLITNNVFKGVEWDAKALITVQTVAQGLLNLTTLFTSQNIQIEALLKVEKNTESIKVGGKK